MSVFLAMAYSGNDGFDLIGTSSCAESAWDNVREWLRGRGLDAPEGAEAITEWLSENGAAEEVTVEELADVMFTPGAAAVTVDDGVCVVTLCDDERAASLTLQRVRDRAEAVPNAEEHWIVPLDGLSGVSEGDHDVTPERYHDL